MKKILTLVIIVSLLMACDENTPDLNKDISVPVSVMEIKPKSIEQYISTTGSVTPLREVSLKSEITGKYTLLTNPSTGRQYALGDYIKLGEIIIILEDKEYENNIKISSLKLQKEISKQVYDKQKSLYDKGGVTLSELKNAEISNINAEYAYEEGLIRLQKMKITATISGAIVDLPYFTQGIKVDANTLLVEIMDYRKLLMELYLAEKNIGIVKVGQKIRIMNYTIPDDTLVGKITQLSPAIDPETRSFKAIVNINNPGLLLRPGMFAKGEIIVASLDSAIVIPKDIVLSKQRGNTVFIIDKGLAKEKIISFGLENPEEVQVISGLEKNDRLVIKGYETLIDNSKVKVVK